MVRVHFLNLARTDALGKPPKNCLVGDVPVIRDFHEQREYGFPTYRLTMLPDSRRPVLVALESPQERRRCAERAREAA